MRQLISIVLIAIIFSVFALPEKTLAWPPTQAAANVSIAGVAIFAMIMGYENYRIKQAEDEMPDGWIEAKITDVTYKERPWWGIRCKIIENGYVYLTPSKSENIGYVIKSEWYGIIKIVDNNEGLWYKIKFSKEHKENSFF
jgi:hypothetical protein